MKRFGIVRLSALGDVVCTLPVAAHLKRAEPDCHVTWIVDSRFAGIVECCTNVDRMISIKRGEKPPRLDPFEVAFDMQGLLKSGLLVKDLKAKRKLGYHWQREGAQFFSQAVLPDPTSFHIVDQYIDVAREAVYAASDRAEFGLRPNPEDVTTLAARLPAEYVVLNPGAGWVTKRWPPASFARVCEWLEAQGLAPVLIGGKSEADMQAFDEVQRETKANLVKLTGETSVRQLVALLAAAKGHVGGDTGSTHLAAAVGVPAVGLYSITRPKRSCPYGQVENCLYEPGGLTQITPEAAIEVLRRNLIRPQI